MEPGIRNSLFRMPAFSFVQSLLTHVRTASTVGAFIEIVLPVLPLFLLYVLQPGVPAAIDMPLHLRAVNDYALVLVSTRGIPDWDPFVFNGFGALTFRYSGQLPLFLASLFSLSGFSPGMALKLSVLAFALAGSWGMREFLRSEGLSWPRRIVGSLMLFSGPGVAMHLYHNFFFQHLCAVLLFPCVLAGMGRSMRRSAVAIGIMCWTHLQMTFVCTILAALASLIRSVIAGSGRQFTRFLAASVIGGFLAAPFWLPAVLSAKEAHFEGKNKVRPGIESLFIDDVFHSSATPPDRVEASAVGQGIERNGTVEIGRIEGLRPALDFILERGGKIHSDHGWVLFRYLRSWILLMVVIILCLAAVGWVDGACRSSFPVNFVGFLSGLAMFRFSMPLWHLFSPMGELLEFSWRLLIPMQILLTPAMTHGGFACALVAGRKVSGKALPAVFLVLFAALPSISAVFGSISRPFTPEDIDYYINEGQAVAPIFKPAHAPLSTSGRPHSAALFPVTVIRGSGQVLFQEPGLVGTKFSAEIAAGGATVRIGAHYDGVWRLVGENREYRLVPAAPDGAMTADLPAGTHDLLLERGMPPGRGPGLILLLIGAAALVFL